MEGSALTAVYWISWRLQGAFRAGSILESNVEPSVLTTCDRMALEKNQGVAMTWSKSRPQTHWNAFGRTWNIVNSYSCLSLSCVHWKPNQIQTEHISSNNKNKARIPSLTYSQYSTVECLEREWNIVYPIVTTASCSEKGFHLADHEIWKSLTRRAYGEFIELLLAKQTCLAPQCIHDSAC